ncbi:hypothetical protein BV22DRAFT_1131164 [Leucogyrophana mollusca]|uniref:Uncharacterized protein n=1 Tax=Leucogyrophana mollusca TaxID=85980 RepID=A0ACB8BD88_9AGAM|nr:hypothetical protein BV22DRAFT_1131164 [Leucogyrophana mollusca]
MNSSAADHADNADFSGYDEERDPKKVRLDVPEVTSSDAGKEPPKPDRLTTLPMELLAEVLMDTNSPRCVLSVARCSKYFCATLVSNPASDFIWRSVRNTCKPQALPDPTPNFSEAAYAAFLFDDGFCEVCRERTRAMYVSFALRIRLCTRPQCRTTFKTESLATASSSAFNGDLRQVTWAPSVESSRCFSPLLLVHSDWPTYDQVMMRQTDWMRFVTEYTAFSGDSPSPEILKLCHRRIKQLPQVMTLAVALSRWKQQYEAMHLLIKTQNDMFAKVLAKREGWELHDLLNCQAYGSLQRHKTKVLEEIKAGDVSVIRADIEAQLLRMKEGRQRRINEDSYRRRRADVEQHYNRLKSGGDIILPTLAEFRKLPVMKVMVGKLSSASTGVAGELKSSPLIRELIRDDLKKWTESVRATLSITLGCPEWKSASKTRLHPLDRLTARFKCKKCDKVAKRYSVDGCLDFAGVCAHQCPHLNKKEAAKYVWSPDQFVKDEKVAVVISRVLVLCGASEDDKGSSEVVHALGPRIRCLSCEAFIVMDFRSVAGHAQRHDDMQVELLPETVGAAVPTDPFESGLCAKLMDLGHKARKMQGLQNYRCRHCLQIGAVLSRGSDQAAPDLYGVGTGTSESSGKGVGKKVKLFDFNALRSHMKAKHKIEVLRDEDFFCHSPLDWEKCSAGDAG